MTYLNVRRLGGTRGRTAKRLWCLVASLLSMAVFVPGAAAQVGRVHQPFAPPMTAEKIRTAIDDAVLFLRSRQATDGSIEEGHRQGGATGLAALAMLAAGANPASDEQLRAALDWLAKLEPNDTYVRAVRANVWEYALRKVPFDARLRKLLKADFDWLLAALGDKQGWRYSMQSRDWDNSCTQYGVLGIWAGTRAGLDPGEEFWQKMSQHFRGCQNDDGGWGYIRGGSSANMCTAGLASLFLVFDMHHGKSFYTRENPRTFAEGDAAAVLASIERGMGWLGSNQFRTDDGYYLYGIERTGVASGRKYLGGRDWFGEGAKQVLAAQAADGSIRAGRWGSNISTAFTTLFLVYGGAPVAFAKLEHGTGHDWNLNPRDLANLTRELWSAYERPLNWQSVSIDDEPSEFEAPLLFISGSAAVQFDEEQMLKLREYVLRGGTILAEPSDHSEPFMRSMEELVQQMFPAADYPDYRLAPLAAEHPVFTVLKQDWDERPKLRGVSNGARTFFLISDGYLSADWQANRKQSDAFRLATNLLFYATDLAGLAGKYSTMLPDTPPAPMRDARIRVARVRYFSSYTHPSAWNAASFCWPQYAEYARHVTGSTLVEEPAVRLGRDSLEGLTLLHLTGQHAIRLSDSERDALRKYVAAGGTLLVDAYTGSPTFSKAAQREIEAMFGKLAPLPADHVLAEGRLAGGVDLSDARFQLPARQQLRKSGQPAKGQKLLVAMVNKRPAVVFSKFDITASAAGIRNYRSLAYRPDSARAILGNLLAYATAD